jgi:hypothetical protein
MTLLNFGQPINGVVQMAFVVEDIHRSMAEYTRKLKIGPWFLREHVCFPKQTYRGSPSNVELSLAHACAGHMMFELIQQHNDVASVYRDVVAKKGYGFHHWGFATDDFDRTVNCYLSAGYEIGFAAETTPGRRVAYIDTTADLPGMVEAIEMTPSAEAMFTSFYLASLGWDGSDPVRMRKAPPPPSVGAGSGGNG